MIRKHVLRNRKLSLWLGGTTLLSGGCDAAAISLEGTAVLLQIIAGFF